MDYEPPTLLNGDPSSLTALYETVYAYYKQHGNRNVFIFEDKVPTEGTGYYVRFLLDRKHVIQYSVEVDRDIYLSGLSLGIGPHYFGPAHFWSYEDSERFTLEASTGGVKRNLALLDEFLGYSI